MKKRRSILSVCLMMLIVAVFPINTFAFEDCRINTDSITTFQIGFEDDCDIKESDILSQTESIKDGRLYIERIYVDKDGNTVTDVFDVGINAMKTPNGQETANRTKTISGFGSVTIKATFEWKTEGMFAYVRCKSMSASKSLESGVSSADNKWSTDYTKDFVKLGSAYAKVTYHFFKTYNYANYTAGNFKITCE